MPYTAFSYSDATLTPMGRTTYITFLQGLSYTLNSTPSGNPTPVPIGQELKSGSVAVPYSTSLIEYGGIPPCTFTQLSGGLPSGLTMTSAGVISGTPTAAGSFSFLIQVQDSVGASYAISFTIVIGTGGGGGGPGVTGFVG